MPEEVFLAELGQPQGQEDEDQDAGADAERHRAGDGPARSFLRLLRFGTRFDGWGAASAGAVSFGSAAMASSAEKLSARMPMASDWNSTATPRSTGSLRNG